MDKQETFPGICKRCDSTGIVFERPDIKDSPIMDCPDCKGTGIQLTTADLEEYIRVTDNPTGKIIIAIATGGEGDLSAKIHAVLKEHGNVQVITVDQIKDHVSPVREAPVPLFPTPLVEPFSPPLTRRQKREQNRKNKN